MFPGPVVPCIREADFAVRTPWDIPPHRPCISLSRDPTLSCPWVEFRCAARDDKVLGPSAPLPPRL
jgi:hypothetical protein